MLRIRIIGLALVAVFAMSAIAAGGASAHEWLLNNAAITTATKIHSSGLLLLEDTNTGVRVHCHGFDSGTVGPGALDLVETVTAELLGTNDKIPCTFDKLPAFTCKSGTTPTALAINLPWHTEIYTGPNGTRDMITSDGAGEPGWAVTCTNVLGGTTVDTCKTALGSTALATTTGGVNATFEAESQKANCTVTGKAETKETGIVEGTDFLESPGGATLGFD